MSYAFDAQPLPLRSPQLPRPILDASRLHPAIADKVANLDADIVHNVQAASNSNPILVVGMGMNPFCRRARKMLDAAGLQYHYLEYGSYFGEWGPRGALKRWSGWPTFPMVFVKGDLIGGTEDLQALIQTGELQRLLSSN
jgi:monothiol glutaredoxin